MASDEDIIAFTDERAARLADISLGQLRRLERASLVGPTVRRQLSARNTVRLYGFRDLEALLVVAALRRQKMTPSHIAAVVGYLRREGIDSPLNEITFATLGREIYFRRPDGTWAGDRDPLQFVISSVVELGQVRARIRREAQAPRNEAQVGRIVRQRKVLGSKPVFAGTRVPLSAVLEYLTSGQSDERILEAFPRLTSADLDQARRQLAS